MLITLTDELNGSSVAEARSERLLITPDPGLARTPVRHEGLLATLFEPPNLPAPVSRAWRGERGSLPDPAALLASRGFTMLALTYFGVEDLPSVLIDTHSSTMRGRSSDGCVRSR